MLIVSFEDNLHEISDPISGKNLWQTDHIFFFIFPEKKIWHFMQLVSISGKSKKNFKIKSDKIITQHARC